MNRLRTGFLLVGIAAAASPVAAGPKYDVVITRTEYGVPHVRARNFGSLAYGQAYAFAEDNFCLLALEFVRVNGELSKYFGPDGGNRESDFYVKYRIDDDLVGRIWWNSNGRERSQIRGYVAGYNRYLRDTGINNVSSLCNGAAWIRRIVVKDLVRYYGQLVLGGASFVGHSLDYPYGIGWVFEGLFQDQIFDATPPGTPRGSVSRISSAADRLAAQLNASTDLSYGSNGLALGRKSSRTRYGIYFSNPHWFWYGPVRLLEVHLTIPRKFDVYGQSIAGLSGVLAGFNADVAWGGTVSPSPKYTFFQLDLVPGNPTKYLVDGVEMDMEETTVSIDVSKNGESSVEEHTFYRSRFGDVLDLPGAPWTVDNALSIRLANEGNSDAGETRYRRAKARNVEDLLAAGRLMGDTRTHFLAATKSGYVIYGDFSRVPNVTDAQLLTCTLPAVENAIGASVPVLDGSRIACNWTTDRDSPAPGITGPSKAPFLVRRDFVQNSNQSHWLSNPKARLVRYAKIYTYGRTSGGERQEASLRTRLGIVQYEDRMAGTDDLPGRRYDLDDPIQVLFSDRNLSAELLRDDVVQVCDEDGPLVPFAAVDIDVSAACAILAVWDTRKLTDSVGAHIWDRVVRGPGNLLKEDIWEVPFDRADAVHTPRDLRSGDAAVRDAVMQAIAAAVDQLAAQALPLDTEWGEAFFDNRDGVEIPLHGGSEYNSLTGVRPGGTGPLRNPLHGASMVWSVSWGRRHPKAVSVMAASASTDPDHPHYSDQTELYAAGGYKEVAFSPRQIEAKKISRIRLIQ